MKEAIRIIQSLLAGEKLDYEGTYYVTSGAKLYSPPPGAIPVWMAAGGPNSATFAGLHADGLITSVKEPASTVEKVINPYREAAASRGASTTVMATRWVVLAADDDEAWEALTPMRGLRAPGRLEVSDPMILRQRADEMHRDEILRQYMIVRDLEELADAYRPLVDDVGADYVAIQVASVEPEAAIKQIGSQVLTLNSGGDGRRAVIRRLSRERLSQVGAEVLDAFDADGEPDEVGRHLQRASGDAGMGHLGRVFDQRLDAAEGLTESEQARTAAHLERRCLAARDAERDHSAEPTHLLGRHLVTAVRRKPG